MHGLLIKYSITFVIWNLSFYLYKNDFFPTIDVFGNGFLPNHDKDNIVFMTGIILSPKAAPVLIKQPNG